MVARIAAAGDAARPHNDRRLLDRCCRRVGNGAQQGHERRGPAIGQSRPPCSRRTQVEANTGRTFEGIDRTLLLLLREAYERDPAHFDLRDWSWRTAPLGELTLILFLIGQDGTLSTGPTFRAYRHNAPISATAIISAPRSMTRPTSFSSARRSSDGSPAG
jgi:hypothetical protein